MAANLIFKILMSIASFEDKPPLLTLETGSIQNLDGGSWTKHLITNGTNYNVFIAVDYNWQQEYVYFSTMDSNIYRIKFDQFGRLRRAQTVLEGETTHMFFSQWAVDWVHDNLFWVDVEKNDTLHIMDLLWGTTKSLAVLDLGYMVMKRIVLDPLNNYIYFLSSTGIDRIGMDGTNRETVLEIETIGLSYYNTHLALDIDNGKLYYNDVIHATINSINTDGTDQRVEIRGIFHVKNFQVYQSNLYFLGKKHGLDILNKYDPVLNTLNEIETDTILGDYKIFHPFAQKQGVDPCGRLNGNCTHICLPRLSGGFTCECPDSLIKYQNTCVSE